MKYKVIALAALAVIIYSCASKSSVPTTEVKNENAKPFEVKKEAPKTTVQGPLSPELAEGKMLNDNNCAKCHRLYQGNEFSAEEWKPIVARMQKKAQLSDLEGLKIYNYLTMQ